MMKLNIFILCTAGCSSVQDAIWSKPDTNTHTIISTTVTSDTSATNSTDTGNWWSNADPILEIYNESHVSTADFCIAYPGQKYYCENMVLLPGYYTSYTIYQPGCYDFKVLAWEDYGWEFLDICLDYGEIMALQLQ